MASGTGVLPGNAADPDLQAGVAAGSTAPAATTAPGSGVEVIW